MEKEAQAKATASRAIRMSEKKIEINSKTQSKRE